MKSFWKLYPILAIVGAVAVWAVAPACREKLPVQLRERWCGYAAVISGRGPVEVAPSDDDDPVPAPAVAAHPRPAPSIGPRPGRPAPSRHAPAARPAPSGSIAAQSSPAAIAGAPAAAAEAEDEMPSTLGIMQTDARDAAWGIVNDVASYRNLSDDVTSGKAAAGAVFIVEQRQRGERGYELIGNFRNHPLDEPVVISAAKLYCFTGSYDSLSERQQLALSSYYRLRGEVEAYKRDKLTEAGKKSPFFEKAVAAKAEFDAKSAEALELEAKLRGGAGNAAATRKVQDELQKMKGELAVLRDKVRSLSTQHKNWKRQNPQYFPDLEKDDKVVRLRGEMANYSKTIPGLAL